jgi:hypothetical protein
MIFEKLLKYNTLVIESTTLILSDSKEIRVTFKSFSSGVKAIPYSEKRDIVFIRPPCFL